LAAMVRWPSVPAAAITEVWNEDWFWSTSEIAMVPEAVRLPAVETLTSSVTSWTVGVPITAASLAPWMVKVTCLVVPSSAVSHTLARATQHELSEDPSDFIATHLLRLSKQFSASTQLFAAAYLLIHGVVKIGLVWALYRKKLWAYPAAIAIFAAFAVYQMYRYFVSASLAMIALTVLDAGIIVLTWIEYGRLKREESLRST